ncbi:hypothetical protein RCL1_000021 [Eukaryota sp. TZLM3-RCL]
MHFFEHNLLECLSQCQENCICCDFNLSFKDVHFPCHKAIISLSSSSLRSVIEKNQDCFDLGEYDDATVDDFKLLLVSFYGQPIYITTNNALSLYLLSKPLACLEISSQCQNVLKTSTPATHQSPLSTLLGGLKNDTFKDFKLLYNNVSLQIHKFLFASISPYFKTKFSRKWQESEENLTDFTGLLKVEPSSFSNFFNSFYNGKLEVNLENAFDYSHLSWYFQLSELEKFVNNFIENSESDCNWVTSLITKAINSEDYRFIKIISAKISEVPDLSNCDPIPVHPLFFENLTSNIDVSWLLKCLVYSYSNFSKENIWTPEMLENIIEKVKFDTLPMDELYQILEPLFSIRDLFDFLSSFSLSIFSKFTSHVPLPWFTWFIVECDKRKEFNLISQVSPLLNEIITPENIPQVPITSFNS